MKNQAIFKAEQQREWREEVLQRVLCFNVCNEIQIDLQVQHQFAKQLPILSQDL